MAINIQIDEELISEAQRLGGHSSKRAAVESALREYIERRKQLEIFKLFGQIDYEDGHDHKAP